MQKNKFFLNDKIDKFPLMMDYLSISANKSGIRGAFQNYYKEIILRNKYTSDKAKKERPASQWQIDY